LFSRPILHSSPPCLVWKASVRIIHTDFWFVLAHS
jgi:hypothetical protein